MRCPKNLLKQGWTEQAVLDVYVHFKANLNKLRAAGAKLAEDCKLPAEITGLSLFENDGKWHEMCKNKYVDAKVEVALADAENQRKQQEEQENQERKRSRQNLFDNQTAWFLNSRQLAGNTSLFGFGLVPLLIS